MSVKCDLCDREFETWFRLGNHVLHDHSIPGLKLYGGGNMVQCVCKKSYFTVLSLLADETHSEFSLHLMRNDGLGTHLMEYQLGVY